MSSNGTIQLGEVRSRAAAALAPAGPNDPTVLVNVVDSVDPPALMLLWDDPWLEPIALAGTIGQNQGRLWEASLMVLCLAGRVEPGAGIEKLEQLVAYTLGRLQADAYTWPPATLRAPRRFEINNLSYLGAQVVYRVRVTV